MFLSSSMQFWQDFDPSLWQTMWNSFEIVEEFEQSPLEVRHFKELPCMIVVYHVYCLLCILILHSIYIFTFFFLQFLICCQHPQIQVQYLPFPNNAFPVLLHLACCTSYLWWQETLNFTVYEMCIHKVNQLQERSGKMWPLGSSFQEKVDNVISNNTSGNTCL